MRTGTPVHYEQTVRSRYEALRRGLLPLRLGVPLPRVIHAAVQTLLRQPVVRPLSAPPRAKYKTPLTRTNSPKRTSSARQSTQLTLSRCTNSPRYGLFSLLVPIAWIYLCWQGPGASHCLLIVDLHTLPSSYARYLLTVCS